MKTKSIFLPDICPVKSNCSADSKTKKEKVLFQSEKDQNHVPVNDSHIRF